MKSLLSILAAGALIGGASADALQTQEAGTFSLVMNYHGEAFEMDQGLTLSDCMGELPRTSKGEAFTCELEG